MRDPCFGVVLHDHFVDCRQGKLWVQAKNRPDGNEENVDGFAGSPHRSLAAQRLCKLLYLLVLDRDAIKQLIDGCLTTLSKPFVEALDALCKCGDLACGFVIA